MSRDEAGRGIAGGLYKAAQSPPGVGDAPGGAAPMTDRIPGFAGARPGVGV